MAQGDDGAGEAGVQPRAGALDEVLDVLDVLDDVLGNVRDDVRNDVRDEGHGVPPKFLARRRRGATPGP